MELRRVRRRIETMESCGTFLVPGLLRHVAGTNRNIRIDTDFHGSILSRHTAGKNRNDEAGHGGCLCLLSHCVAGTNRNKVGEPIDGYSKLSRHVAGTNKNIEKFRSVTDRITFPSCSGKE